MKTFHGKDSAPRRRSLEFREWLETRKPVVFVSDNPAYDFQWINFYFWRYFGVKLFGIPEGASPISTLDWSGISEARRRWKRLRRTKHDHHPVHDALGTAEALIRIFEGER